MRKTNIDQQGNYKCEPWHCRQQDRHRTRYNGEITTLAKEEWNTNIKQGKSKRSRDESSSTGLLMADNGDN